MEHQIQPTPSPSSLASLLNPLPTTDHQQQQQHPLKKILLADNTRSLPTKQNNQNYFQLTITINITAIYQLTINANTNYLIKEYMKKNYGGAKVDDVHTKEIDDFHDKQIRVSKDWSGKNHNSTPRSIAKEKLAHLDIHCPGQQFDFRISVNIGHPVPLPPDHLIPDYKRINDQLSYSHQICQINWNAPVPVLDTSGTGTRIGLACTAGTCSQ
ncbi:hypothetical protein PSHT_13581 [Puccinia striiformis]|uniref:mRNA-capping enzyme subunit beta n=1 Tax=Puccinia striiformis TaxID=27350 RepID=A0A2S4UQ76_9BASI|nr:hypothetical protein PSHT_13581 [Puccinia striiformis]